MVTGARAGPLPRRCVTVELLPVRQNGSFARSEGEADVDNRNFHREFGLVSPEVAGRVSGVEFLQRLLDATYPAPPFSEVAEVWPISVEVGATSLTATVSDHGRGFEPDPAELAGGGLLSMRERVELVGGSLSIRPGPTGGTTVAICVPLSGESR